MRDYCQCLKSKMKIGLGLSTYAFMIADPLAVLEENEVHIGFSSSFQDHNSDFDQTMLHNLDILVARIPAHLPSDIQKVSSTCCRVTSLMELKSDQSRFELCSSPS